MIPILTIALSNPTGDELPFRELAEKAGPAVFQCLVDANVDGPVLVDVSAKDGNLSIKPASSHEGPVEVCVTQAVLGAERPALPAGSAQIAFGVERSEAAENDAPAEDGSQE